MPTTDTADAVDRFREHGWAVVELPDPEPVRAARASLSDELRLALGDSTVTLERYHERVDDDEGHTALQHRLAMRFREGRFGQRIVGANLAVACRFLGADIDIQRDPLLRVVRPDRPRDAIGFHRDTFYGDSPYEVSFWVPYVDVDASNALRVVPGSHLLPDRDFPTTQVDDPVTRRGSVRNRLGFPYSPKIIEESRLSNAVAVPTRVGQAIVLSLLAVHGAKNQGGRTRWSSDIRLIHAFAPIGHVNPNYFEPLARSAVTRVVDAYAAANGKTDVEVGATAGAEAT